MCVRLPANREEAPEGNSRASDAQVTCGELLHQHHLLDCNTLPCLKAVQVYAATCCPAETIPAILPYGIASSRLSSINQHPHLLAQDTVGHQPHCGVPWKRIADDRIRIEGIGIGLM